MKYVFLGYILVAVAVIGYGWTSRPAPEPFSNIPAMPGSVLIAVPEDVDLLPNGAADEVPVVAVEMNPTSETERNDIVEATAPPEDSNRLDDHDLRLSGDSEQDVTQFEEVEPNPYLVTD